MGVRGGPHYAMEGDLERAKEAGCDGFVAKPIDTRNFLDTVREIMQDGVSLSPGTCFTFRPPEG